MNTELDGIHFDSIPDDFSEIKSRFTSNTIIGITCGNDISKIKLAMNHQLSYISFCSIFPSSSVSTCDLVDKEVISQARALTNMPIFLSGGIDLNNIDQLKETQMDGVALVSGIMSAENVKEKVMQYQQKLKKNKK
jgi:thiamine-phosphate pyrophosphorylase